MVKRQVKHYAQGSASALAAVADALRPQGGAVAPVSIVRELVENHRTSIYQDAQAATVLPWQRARWGSTVQGAVDSLTEALRVLDEMPGQDAPGGDKVSVDDFVRYLDRKAERWRYLERTGTTAPGPE